MLYSLSKLSNSKSSTLSTKSFFPDSVGSSPALTLEEGDAK